MRAILSNIFLVMVISIFGQPADTIPYDKLFVKLKNGEVLYGHSFLTQEGLHHNRMVLDGKMLEKNSVAFYNDGALYGCLGGSYFIKEVYHSKGLVFYQAIQKTGSEREPLIKQYNCYYSAGLRKVKKLRSGNLINDIPSNDPSYELMKKARKSFFGRKKKVRKALLVFAPELPKYLPEYFSKKQRKEAGL